jgi:hypothetical protein
MVAVVVNERKATAIIAVATTLMTAIVTMSSTRVNPAWSSRSRVRRR